MIGQASNSSQNPAQKFGKNTDFQSNVSTFPGSNQNNIQNLNPKPNSNTQNKENPFEETKLSTNEDTFFPKIHSEYELDFKINK